MNLRVSCHSAAVDPESLRFRSCIKPPTSILRLHSVVPQNATLIALCLSASLAGTLSHVHSRGAVAPRVAWPHEFHLLHVSVFCHAFSSRARRAISKSPRIECGSYLAREYWIASDTEPANNRRPFRKPGMALCIISVLTRVLRRS